MEGPVAASGSTTGMGTYRGEFEARGDAESLSRSEKSSLRSSSDTSSLSLSFSNASEGDATKRKVAAGLMGGGRLTMAE